MARYAAVANADGIIAELRHGDAPPNYVPPDYQWIDVTSSPVSDQNMVGGTWDGTQVIARPTPMNLDPKWNIGPTMFEILNPTSRI